MNSFIFLGMESDYGISIAAFCLLFIPLIARLWMDRYVIKIQKMEVEHGLHTLLTAALMVVSATGVYLIDPVYYWIQPFMLEWGVFWFFFDPVLNLLLGKNWYYVDEDVERGGKFAKIEQFYYRLGIWNTLFIRAWWLLFTFSLYFYLSYVL